MKMQGAPLIKSIQWRFFLESWQPDVLSLLQSTALQGGSHMQASARFLCKPTFCSLLMVLIVIVLALTLAPALFGQAYFGTVSGELKDSTGAVVTGAKVVLMDQQKGFHFEAISDNTGRYLFRSIPPGVYVVSVQSAGFAKTESAKFKVDVNQNASANLTLK